MPCWIDNNNTMLWPCSLCFYLSILISLCFHPTFLNNITMLVLPALVFLFLSPTFNGKSQNWPCLSCFLFYFILFQSFTLRSPGAALSRICLERASNVLIAICNIFATGGFFFFPTVLHSLNFSCQNFISCYFLFYFHPTFFF